MEARKKFYTGLNSLGVGSFLLLCWIDYFAGWGCSVHEIIATEPTHQQMFLITFYLILIVSSMIFILLAMLNFIRAYQLNSRNNI